MYSSIQSLVHLWIEMSAQLAAQPRYLLNWGLDGPLSQCPALQRS
jgi:hypothetical protein